jgi:hypothetical protein
VRLLSASLLLSLLLGPATGATFEAAARPWPLLAADTTAPPLDTARVLAEFFAHRRKTNRTIVLPVASATVALNYALAYSKSETAFQQVRRGLNVAVIGCLAYRLGKALVQLRRYRAGRERALLAALARGEPIPPRVRTRLAAYLWPTPVSP